MADLHDFKAGDRLRVKAAMYRPSRTPEDTTMIMRGQIMEVNEQDVRRSDAHLIWERPTEDEAETLASSSALIEGDAEDLPFDFTNPTYATLQTYLEKLTVPNAKKFLSREEWTVDALTTARDAEVSGKNRDSILDYIDGRIEQVAAEDAEEGPVS